VSDSRAIKYLLAGILVVLLFGREAVVGALGAVGWIAGLFRRETPSGSNPSAASLNVDVCPSVKALGLLDRRDGQQTRR
jgi:hypothetical protein